MTSYHEGKSRGGKEIAEYIITFASMFKKFPIKGYWEPFCGMCGVYRHIVDDFHLVTRDNKSPYFLASDAHKSLILLWKALQKNWKPPTRVSRNLYNKTRDARGSSPDKAYIGFGYSFGGKYFGGYKNYPEYKSRNKLVRELGNKFSKHNVLFRNMLYDEISPRELSGFVIYCDPPYGGDSTNSYFKTDEGDKIEKFDSDAFWQWARKMSRKNIVFISDYDAPKDFIPIQKREIKTTGKKNCDTLTYDYLFVHKNLVDSIL